MIDIALTDEQRHDRSLAQLRRETITGPVSVDHGPYSELVRGIRDREVCRLLAESHNTNTSEAPQRIFERFQATMEWLEKHALRKSDAPTFTLEDLNVVRDWGIHPPNWEKSDHAEVDAASAYILWRNLATNIQIAAERLWRDEFLGFETKAQAKAYFSKSHVSSETAKIQLIVRTRWAHQLYLLWIEVRLYGIRAANNFNLFQQQRFDTDEKGMMSSQIGGIVHEYVRMANESGRDLRPVIGVNLFQQEYGDIERLKTLGLLFGPGSTSPQEVGWQLYAEEAEEALNFQYLDLRRVLYRQNGRWTKYLWYSMLKVTIGYGARPLRFIALSLNMVWVFSVLYFFNDFLNSGIEHPNGACAQAVVQGHSLFEIVVHYVYLAVVNLTSLGADPSLAHYCGGIGTSILLMLSTVTGYFLLAMLATLMIQGISLLQGGSKSKP